MGMSPPEVKSPSKTATTVSRRDFLKSGAAIAAVVAVSSCSRSTPTPTRTPTPTPTVTPAPGPTPLPVFDALQFFSPNQATTVHAAAGRIIPGNAQDPGAKEAGAVVFIDRALEGYDIAMQPQYHAGIAGIEAYAQAKYTKGFADVTDAQQEDILTNMQGNTDEAKKYLPNPGSFFGTLLTHTRQGTFGDPIYGGNRGEAGWKLVDHPGIVFGRDTSQQKCDVDFPKEYMGSQEYYANHAT
jgi:gluconate 2-dehydrogenase gamma chain